MGTSSIGVEPTSVDQRAPGANPESLAPASASESAFRSEPVPGLSYDIPEVPMDANPAPVGDLGPQPALSGDPETAPPVDRAPEPTAFEGDDPLPSQVEEAPSPGQSIPDPESEEASPLLSLKTTLSSAAETLGSTASTLQDLVGGSLLPAAEDESLIGTALVGLFSGEETDDTPLKATEPSPTGTESSPKDAPQPLPPPTPPTDSGSFLSLSGGGQIGSGSGIAPLLLLCVLASGLILLPRSGGLSRAFCELPKPSSALLMPLERPG